jgi:hypothetical protein
METISSMNSVSVTLTQLLQSKRAITEYTEKYGARLAPKNLKSLKDIKDITHSLAHYIQDFQFEEEGETKTTQRTLDVMDVLVSADLYKQDFQKISDFFDRSDLIRKINGYISGIIQKEMTAQGKPKEAMKHNGL